jgi:hypothetical protein
VNLLKAAYIGTCIGFMLYWLTNFNTVEWYVGLAPLLLPILFITVLGTLTTILFFLVLCLVTLLVECSNFIYKANKNEKGSTCDFDTTRTNSNN